MFSKQKEFIDSFALVIFKEFQQTLEMHNLIVKDYIIERQLYNKGEDGDDKRLKGYTRTTIRLKIAKGLPADRTTLYDEGNFYHSIKITATPKYFLVSSDVSYDVRLTKKYGKNILKVSRENMREFFAKFYIPNLKNYVNNQLTK